MMKRTHLIMGVAATIPFVTWNNVPFVPVAILGAIAADLDIIIGTRHRNIGHSILALAGSTGAFMLFNIDLGLLWALNYIIHLLLDSMTLRGVPFFYPFTEKYYGFKLFKTRGSEDMFTALLGIYLITTMLGRQ